MELHEIFREIEKLAEGGPEKEKAYAAYNVKGNHIYVSTTNDDSFDGRVPFDDFIDNFIEGEVRGDGGTIEKNIGHGFAKILRDAANKILESTES